jgi:hypothetical protein
MRKLALNVMAGLLLTAAGAVLASASSTQSKRQPALRVVAQQPFTVQGRSFRSHERVKLTLYTQQKSVRTRRVTAGSSGAFRAVLQTTPVDRCDAILVRAVGALGSTATLKLLPLPACHSA